MRQDYFYKGRIRINTLLKDIRQWKTDFHSVQWSIEGRNEQRNHLISACLLYMLPVPLVKFSSFFLYIQTSFHFSTCLPFHFAWPNFSFNINNQKDPWFRTNPWPIYCFNSGPEFSAKWGSSHSFTDGLLMIR